MAVTIKNHGKTPADLNAFLLRLVVNPTLPPQPVYGNDAVDMRTVVMPGEAVTISKWSFQPIPGALYNAIQSGQMTLWVIGYIDYRDRFDTLHRGGYGRRYDPEIDHTVPENQRNNLVFEVRPDYNYDIEINEQGHPRPRWAQQWREHRQNVGF